MEDWKGYYKTSTLQYSRDNAFQLLEEAMMNAPSQLEVEHKKVLFYNIPASFDIETTSFKTKDDNEEDVKHACMYIWQFGLNGSVIYGRTWDQFFEFLGILQEELELSNRHRLIIYVHNLAYEFQFLNKWIEWDKVFALKQRRPIYAIAGGFEFRCSLILSNYALAYIGGFDEKTGKPNLLYKYPMKKMVGDLDYSKLRNSVTPLSSSELGYCINDVKVVMCYIQQKIEEDGDITKIPLTNTGYVREYCREWCFYSDKVLPEEREKNKTEYHRLMTALKINSPEEYYQMEHAFAGGFTHTGALHSTKVLRDVGSADLTSSYPYHMIAEYFPMSSFKYIGRVLDNRLFYFFLRNYCCMFDVTFINLRPAVTFENPLSKSRCIIPKDKDGNELSYQVNNGRLVSADECTTTLTELDWDTIYKFYTWDEVRIFNMRIANRGYLPRDLIIAILHLYGNKTSLKGVEGKHVEYMVSKNMINASFGMMVTAIIRDEFVYDEEWHKVAPDIASQLEAYNHSYNRFLFYGWGIWVTAHARHSLFKAIYEFDEDYVYADTDSIKGLHFEDHMQFFKEYNREVQRKLLKMCNHYDIPFSACQPKTVKGEKKLIVVWDMERPYKRFKACGAKRYMYEYDDGELSLTVSGLNKKFAIPWLLSEYKTNAMCFEIFGEGMFVPAGHTGKQTITYIETEDEGELTDYLGNKAHYHELSSIYMEPQAYLMSVLTEYNDFLEGVQYVEI